MENQINKKTKKVTAPNENTFKVNTQLVGIRKTRLMELGESYGDTGLMNPRSIDPLVYMLAELGEINFGASVIDECWNDIALSNANFPKQKALGFLTDHLIRFHLAKAFQGYGKIDVGNKLSNLPVLNSSSYIDFFMTVSFLDKDAFRTDLHPVMNDIVKMVTAYQSEQAGPVCNAVVNFFKATKDKKGFEETLKKLCSLVKNAKRI